MKKYIIALDQGTTSSRTLIFDEAGQVVATSQREFTQYYPNDGWVEHIPEEIWQSQRITMEEAMQKAGITGKDVAAIGITNQRETTIVWDRATGMPVYNAIVWQCRRTAPMVDRLQELGLGDYIRKTTGLVPDAYFSGTKIRWILDNVPGAMEQANAGNLCFGTVDSWLIWKLTGGKRHVTDVTNASRTMVFDIHKLCWDKTMLDTLGIPASMMPEVVPSSGIAGYALLDGAEVPIAGIAGDQQSALFGQCCFDAGETKCTYGTGCFVLMNTGDKPMASRNGLVTTVAFGSSSGVSYALEGSVFVGGAVIQWLRDEMRLFSDSRDAEYLATKVPNNGGVYLVPAFTGLGAPYWDMYARGAIVGITRATRREHIVRAAQESIAYQVADLMDAMAKDTSSLIPALKVDGGASRDSFLMQFQADVLGLGIVRPQNRETTALGACYMAGLGIGVWGSLKELRSLNPPDHRFLPAMSEEKRQALRRDWKRAVERSMGWAK